MIDVVLSAAGGEARTPSGETVVATIASRHHAVWIDIRDPLPGSQTAVAALLAALVDRAVTAGAAGVHWASEAPEGDLVDAVADAAGLTERRDLLQLRRSLPLGPECRIGVPEVATRGLRLGTADEEAWVRTNNRAFAHHPDQGQETVESFRATSRSPWFAAEDIRLVDGTDGDGLAAFCWTKRHPPSADDPALGEIFVIGVDPDHQGGGIGAGVVLAGLDHLAGRGMDTAMLYVDVDAAPARRLYDRLGFIEHQVRRVRSTGPVRRDGGPVAGPQRTE